MQVIPPPAKVHSSQCGIGFLEFANPKPWGLFAGVMSRLKDLIDHTPAEKQFTNDRS